MRVLNKDEKKMMMMIIEKFDKVVVKKVFSLEGLLGDDEKKEGVKKKIVGLRRIKGDVSKWVKKEGGEVRKI